MYENKGILITKVEDGKLKIRIGGAWRLIKTIDPEMMIREWFPGSVEVSEHRLAA